MTPAGGSMTLAPQIALAKTDGTGAATFTFASPPINYAWIGTVSVPSAGPGAVFTAAIDGRPLPSFNGNAIMGPVQIMPGQALAITGAHLTPNMQFQAVLIGSQVPETQAQGAAPLPSFSSASPELIANVVTTTDAAILTASSPTAQYLIFAAWVACAINAAGASLPGLGSIYQTNNNVAFLTAYCVGTGPTAGAPGSNSIEYPGGFLTALGASIHLAAGNTTVAAGGIAYTQMAT